ncbi:Uncharacterized 2Fe-2 and 4Fe-4S clusters-containing protein, contains DUF4445 domain [Butyrivibrio sp. INlla18]|uniref:ASKHA domain-containing protein n=1 Tax=Butyrivibrio sp. INlla18 TaxID=1520806 RepID=UPI000886A9AA|nr:ASKHA domain-containing protein [Butyrivibrio sp. INlla18]SDA76952.1 Uncharacterized 2Fe-2 and 4Fe-4S clusters-containing protein, contains DUF4445 domain [Butyrivibrio sp. INlla18]
MKAKKLAVYIKNSSKSFYVAAPYGKLLKGLFSDAGITMSMPCAGTGRCGKCKVTFIKGAPEPNSLDQAFLTEDEIVAGVRLACRCVLDKDCIISAEGLTFDETSMEVQSVETADMSDRAFDKYGIAIDLGTTTIAAALIGFDADSNETQIIKTASTVNHQRAYGSDVISRIAAAEDEACAHKLKELVTADIESLIGEVSDSIGKRPELICLAGNTTMLYLLCGDDTKELGQYPYKASHLSFRTEELRDIKTIMLPGISAFVGADIVSGIYSLDLLRGKGETALLIDFGTNGEIVYYDGDKLFTTSTAAGPVFEGGGISSGVPSVKGAIDHVTIHNGRAEVTTIGDEAPMGLCGTGVIETMSELLRNDYVDETGLLTIEFFEKGYPVYADEKIFFTQQDIRNVQLAKAAIYTGIKALTKETIPSKVYISGGFGSHIDTDKISNINMFPKEFNGNMLPIGNSSLKGVIRFLSEVFMGKEKEATEAIEEITKKAETVVLADDNSFNSEYLEAMNF